MLYIIMFSSKLVVTFSYVQFEQVILASAPVAQKDRAAVS